MLTIKFVKSLDYILTLQEFNYYFFAVINVDLF